MVPGPERLESRAADVLLDPLHFNGGNTSLKALALGAPIVTLPTALLKGRLTLGLYRKMGVLDGVAAIEVVLFCAARVPSPDVTHA